MSRRLTATSPPDELRTRDEAVDYTIILMRKLSEFFEFLYPRDAKFHWALFSIFDTAAVLCSAILHDEDCCILRRADVILAVESARSMLERLATETRTAKTSYEILSRLLKRIENPYSQPNLAERHYKRTRHVEQTLTPPFFNQAGEISHGSSEVGSADEFDAYSASPGGSGGMAASIASASPVYGSNYVDAAASYQMPTSMAPVSNAYDVTYTMAPNGVHMMADSMLMPAPSRNPYLPPTPQDSYAQLSLDGFSEEQLGDLASLWNYQSLDLSFVPTQNV